MAMVMMKLLVDEKITSCVKQIMAPGLGCSKMG